MKANRNVQGLCLILLVMIACTQPATAQWGTGGNTGCTSFKLGSTDTTQVSLSTNDTTRMVIKHDGHVGIGTGKTTGYLLSVNGKTRAREVVVNTDTWSDFVFDSCYQLTDLKILEAQLKADKHLPGVPSAAEVQDNGVALGEMNKILLQKVEELTLYLIAQQKEIDALKAKQAGR